MAGLLALYVQTLSASSLFPAHSRNAPMKAWASSCGSCRISTGISLWSGSNGREFSDTSSMTGAQSAVSRWFSSETSAIHSRYPSVMRRDASIMASNLQCPTVSPRGLYEPITMGDERKSESGISSPTAFQLGSENCLAPYLSRVMRLT